MGIRTNNADGSTVDFLNAAVLRDDPITIMEWVNWYADTGDTLISVWEGGADRAWRMSAADAPTEMRARISDDGADQNSVSSSTAITNGVWNHMAMMYDGVDLEFWLNGVLDASSAQAGIFDSTANLAIGGQEGGGNTSDTEHADIRIYDRILGPEEMETIAAARGHDGIVDGLVFRCLGKEGGLAALVSAANPKDIGPNAIGFAGGFGSPVPSYVEDGGLSFRRRV